MTDNCASAFAPEPYPFDAGRVGDQDAEYARRRRSCPFGTVRLPSGHDAVLLTRHEDVAPGLADPRLSRDLTAPGAPRIYLGASLMDDPEVLGNMEGEAHLRLRRLLSPSFTPRSVERRLPLVEEIASGLIDGLVRRGGPVDIIDTFARRLPAHVMYRLLGVPEEDSEPFMEWSGAFALSAKVTEEERARKMAEFTAYVTGLIAARRAAPGRGLVDELIGARDGTDRLSERELVSQVIALIAAGTETTTTMIGRGLLTLLDDGRARWEELRARPDRLPAAVEELLRHNPLLRVPAMRVAQADVTLPSGTVRAGQPVLLAIDSALGDEDAYPDAGTPRFDREEREGFAKQLAFGAGVHYCLGAPLARAILRIGLRRLMERLPGLRLASDPARLRWTDGEKINSLVELPVTW
ncbi:cytochrome P450 [Streptomyces sp. NPDC050264]|uniref:cytochrome P450 n=1 Tax=Streptomyces sp. NPDC050264 TaxID=3155038 RepID=UPI0034415099